MLHKFRIAYSHLVGYTDYKWHNHTGDEEVVRLTLWTTYSKSNWVRNERVVGEVKAAGGLGGEEKSRMTNNNHSAGIVEGFRATFPGSGSSYLPIHLLQAA